MAIQSYKSVIATVGLCGVGKSEATNFLSKKFGSDIVYFGGQITNEVKRRGLEVNPENERYVREELRERYGMDAITRLAQAEITDKTSKGQTVVIDGIYSYAEVLYLREKVNLNLTIIAIHARKALRYERMRSRKIRPLSKEQVDARDMSEITALDKATPIALADIHVVNNDDINALHIGINDALSQLGFLSL